MTIHRTTMHRASLHRTTRRAAVADGRRHPPGDAGHDIRRAVRSTVGERILHRLATEQGDVPGGWVLITLVNTLQRNISLLQVRASLGGVAQSSGAVSGSPH